MAGILHHKVDSDLEEERMALALKKEVLPLVVSRRRSHEKLICCQHLWSIKKPRESL